MHNLDQELLAFRGSAMTNTPTEITYKSIRRGYIQIHKMMRQTLDIYHRLPRTRKWNRL